MNRVGIARAVGVLLLILMSSGTMVVLGQQEIVLAEGRFAKGDDAGMKAVSLDDTRWGRIRTDQVWERQGFPDYDGYAWYRIHFVLPVSLRDRSLRKDSLRVFLGKIDDADETYLNGVRIGKTGGMPSDAGGYWAAYYMVREYRVALSSGLLNWGGENVLAVRVYDGGGGGGLSGGLSGATPFVSMVDVIDGVELGAVTGSGNRSFVRLTNKAGVAVRGKLDVTVRDEETGAVLRRLSASLVLGPHRDTAIGLLSPGERMVSLRSVFTQAATGKTKKYESILPYILTPTASLKPQIHGPSVYGTGVRTPLVYRIPVTGRRPMRYAVKDLPAGLRLDAASGIITGALEAAGDYKLLLQAGNALGSDEKVFVISAGKGMALTPAMGWNSWNCWGVNVSAEKVRSSAQALIDQGLADHGWSYMNIDDGWQAKDRAADGRIVANEKFPDMRGLGDWLHMRGLKLGVYSSPGPLTCGGYTGSWQHEGQDARTYADWGVDYLKYDWCSYGGIAGADTAIDTYIKPYRVMRDALQAQNRSIYYSLCQYGMRDVWKWGPSAGGQSWRTTGDINDSWESLAGIGFYQGQEKLWPYAGPGHWNDPDMLIVGQVGWGSDLHPTRLTPDEQYTHISLWCLLSAPLLIGCDIARMDDFTRSLLSNDEVLAVDQDVLGRQARRQIDRDSVQVFVKELEGGGKAIGVFNLSGRYRDFAFDWEALGLSGPQSVRDLWRQKGLGVMRDGFSTRLAPHGVRLIRVKAAGAVAGRLDALDVQDTVFAGVRALALRRVPWLAGQLDFSRIDGVDGFDKYVLSTSGGRVSVAANNANAAAAGLNRYLKYYCLRSMSHMGDNLSPVAVLPVVPRPDTVIAAALYRQALNYCTYNYTMSFYRWEDWEHELDWMALNGVNLMLVANGEEAVWKDVLEQLGYNAKEIADYITGPAYNAWWLMGNIQGWGGPMPLSQIEGRKALVQKMLARMHGLGIQPIMPGFYGMVPSNFSEKTGAHVFKQGTWGAFTRPDILDPADPSFDKVAALFYGATKKFYGEDIHYFSGDPFHEGGQTAGADIGKVGLAIQRVMHVDYPGSVWVLQGWQDNPKKDLLSVVDRSTILVQELFGENTNNWETRQGYEGTPFIWCTVTNFGERPGISGKLQRFADEVYRAGHGPWANYMKGVGIMPEGINNNPVVYECMMELGWHRDKVDIASWIEGFIAARYGRADKDLSAAWKLLLQTAYSSTLGYQEGPPENVLCARPALAIKSVSSWGTVKKNYDRAVFDEAVRLFGRAGLRFTGSTTYKLDWINFRRQEMANRADGVFDAFVRAYKEKNAIGFGAASKLFLRMIDSTDLLLNGDAYYTLSGYKKMALAAGGNAAEKENDLLNALMLITYWGEHNRAEDNLHEYAYKEWGGMMRSFYKKRWEMYFDYLGRKLAGDSAAAAPDFWMFERDWVKKEMGTPAAGLRGVAASRARGEGLTAAGLRRDGLNAARMRGEALPAVRVQYGSADMRYKKDSVPSAGGDSTWEAVGWKGDKVQTQVLVWCDKPLSGVRLETGALRSKAGAVIPASAVQYGFVNYVLTNGLNSDGGGCGIPDSVQRVSWSVADGIGRAAAMDVPAGALQPVWVSIKIPRGLAAGVYRGSLRVVGTIHDGLPGTAGRRVSIWLPYTIRVQDHVLPVASKWSYHLDLWQNPYAIARVHGVKPWSEAHFAAMRPYMKMLADAGQRTITVSMIYDPWRGQTYDIYGSMIIWIREKDGHWRYDYSIFDKWVSFMMGMGIDGLINCYTMVAWNSKYYFHDAATGKDTSLEAVVGSPEYASHWRSMLSDFRAHLIGKGWFGKTAIAMDERALEDMRRVIALVKSVDPAFKISLAGSFHPEIEKDIYDYCIGSGDAFDSVTLAGRLSRGWPTTYYTCCVEGRPNTFTFSPPAEAEWLGWYTASKGYNGYLRWAYNCWPANPMVDSRFGPWSAGDTYLVYPGAGSSIRFERLVQGIREYEKIKVLEADFARSGDRVRLERLQLLLTGWDMRSLGVESAAAQLAKARLVLEELGEQGAGGIRE